MQSKSFVCGDWRIWKSRIYLRGERVEGKEVTNSAGRRPSTSFVIVICKAILIGIKVEDRDKKNTWILPKRGCLQCSFAFRYILRVYREMWVTESMGSCPNTQAETHPHPVE